MPTEKKSPLRKIVELVDGVGVLAAFFKISSAAVSQWLRNNRVPSDRCLQLEQAQIHFLGRVVVSRYEMRPDIFGPPPKRK